VRIIEIEHLSAIVSEEAILSIAEGKASTCSGTKTRGKGRDMATRDSHSETMAKRTVRAEIGLLRDDWFLPVQAAATDKALVYVGPGHNLPWKEAARRGLEETFTEFKIEGLNALVQQSQGALEAGGTAT
jgi:hypothetical protein